MPAGSDVTATTEDDVRLEGVQKCSELSTLVTMPSEHKSTSDNALNRFIKRPKLHAACSLNVTGVHQSSLSQCIFIGSKYFFNLAKKNTQKF